MWSQLCKIYATCVAQHTHCGVSSRGWCQAGDLEKLQLALFLQLSHCSSTVQVQPMHIDYVRQHHKHFMKIAFIFITVDFRIHFPILSVKKLSVRKSVEWRIQRLNCNVLYHGIRLQIKEMGESFLAVEILTGSLAGDKVTFRRIDALSSEWSITAVTGFCVKN